ncbi:hypothetical protein niasHS_014277 [Heterodera schachtii]|uniref:DIX domain-containing protein n=1 Tax=Heterodera schachtii TaxID=97005 RepID=A0ABD2I6Y5_HETSC
MCSSHCSSVGIGTAILDDDGVGTVPKASSSPSPYAASSPLQATLDHPRTFAAFYHWLSARGRAYVLDFWLAIWAFRRAWLDRDPRAPRIGMAFHRRFVSPHSGCCEFLPPALRAERTERLQREPMRENFFDACAPHAWACLTREHMQYAMMRGAAKGAEKRNGGDSAQRQMTEQHQQRESGQEGECVGGKEAECRAFALQLVHKLDALAHKTAEEQTTEAAECDEDACDAASAEASVTPERMCAWMQFASAYSGLTALSSSSCNNADGVSSSCSSTAGGYMTFSIASQPAAQLQAVQQQQHPPHQQRHCDNTPTTPATSATSFMMMASATPGSRNGSNGTSQCSMSMAGSTAAATGAPVMTITYREAGGVGPPFVVRVAPQAVVTFREFRHLFAIPARSNKRFLFKEHRFDEPLDGAHFQWTAIYDDESPLPIFFGQIVAECRTLSESD